MKIVVIGGSGLIGKRLVQLLIEKDQLVIAASPSRGVNAVTGEGLDAALQGASVVVDVSNSPSFAEADVMEFFVRSTTNLLAAEARAGVAHHVALSVVGADRLKDSAYMRAKVAQEDLIQASGIPYTIVRATQFFEFLAAIGASGGEAESVHLPAAPMQPLAAADVSAALAEIALSPPRNAILELAGPESLSIAEFIQRYFRAAGNPRTVIADPDATYFGAALNHQGLTPGPNAQISPTRFEDWATNHFAVRP